MARYIVIELGEKDNGADIMNFLMSRPKARFTITDDICEYAAERQELWRARTTEKEAVVQKRTSPALENFEEPPSKRPCEEDPREEPEPSCSVSSDEFRSFIPKVEPLDSFQFANDVSEDWNSVQSTSEPIISYSTLAELMKTSAMLPVTTPSVEKRRRQNTTYQCRVCDSYIKAYNMDYYKRSNHAIIHTGLQRYICPLDGCGAKTRHRSNMVVHARTAHGLTGKINVQNCLLPHEEDELKETVVRCFPEMAETVLAMKIREKEKSEEGVTEGTTEGLVESDDDFVEEVAYGQ